MNKKTIIGFGIFGVVALWVGCYVYGIDNFNTWAERGQFGDLFGAVNALFSGLAFLGLIIAIFLQRNELELQREELKLTREELSGQKLELKNQNETMRLQLLEATFFQMLSLHNEIVKSLFVPNTTNGIRGRDVFRRMEQRIKQSPTQSKEFAKESLDEINNAYLRFFTEWQDDLSHYFRHLYHIVKFIDQSDIVNKKFYTNILRAQLSNSELFLLFYNCLSTLGREKFKPLIEKYALLKTLQNHDLINPNHKLLYDSKAFGG